jgi:hypothetical protein
MEVIDHLQENFTYNLVHFVKNGVEAETINSHGANVNIKYSTSQMEDL